MTTPHDVFCWFKKRLIAAGMIAGAVTALFIAGGYIDQVRWWVWASEFKLVASRVYEVTIPEQRRVISSIQRELERAKSVPPAKRKALDIRKINDLEEDLANALEKLESLVDERARFATK